MSLRDFIAAAYAVLVDTWLTVAPNRIDLISAVEKVDGAIFAEKAPDEVARQNEGAMAQLQAMMAGVSK